MSSSTNTLASPLSLELVSLGLGQAMRCRPRALRDELPPRCPGVESTVTNRPGRVREAVHRPGRQREAFPDLPGPMEDQDAGDPVHEDALLVRTKPGPSGRRLVARRVANSVSTGIDGGDLAPRRGACWPLALSAAFTGTALPSARVRAVALSPPGPTRPWCLALLTPFGVSYLLLAARALMQRKWVSPGKHPKRLPADRVDLRPLIQLRIGGDGAQ